MSIIFWWILGFWNTLFCGMCTSDNHNDLLLKDLLLIIFLWPVFIVILPFMIFDEYKDTVIYKSKKSKVDEILNKRMEW